MTIQDLELKISKLLRAGVVISGIVISIGWVWSVIANGADLFQYKQYHAVSLVDSVRNCLAMGDYASLVVYAGLAILVMLPAARVLLTGVLFLTQKEKILGWVAISVFVVLVTSFLLGANL